jgi:hypothetical protein
MPTKTLSFEVVFVAILLVVSAHHLRGQTNANATTWDGVFSDVQASRGRGHYEAHCASCHGEDLAGREGRALVGSQFWQSWGEDSLQSLLSYMKTTMPHGAPGSLASHIYVDIVAFILLKNDFPPGRDELSEERFPGIRVVGKEGPGPVPNFALVTVIGCLGEASPAKWMLTRASAAVRTRNPEPSTGDERRRSEATPLGGGTFELMSVPPASAEQGRRVETKGLLIRGAPDRLNVTSIQPLDGACPP